MADEVILEILKINLQISTDKLDTYLSGLISAAGEYIKTEGIALQDTPGDRNLVSLYVHHSFYYTHTPVCMQHIYIVSAERTGLCPDLCAGR